MSLLSQDERDRADRFHFAVDRTRFILARAALRTLVGQAAGQAPEEIEFSTGPYGKPGLKGRPDLHFNVSHSGALALIGISSERPIGVDIEIIRENMDELALARTFFCEDEFAFLSALDAPARLRAFYKIWTCKEAVLKAFGVGISTNLKDFSVELTQDGVKIHPTSACFTPALAMTRIEPIEVPAGYAGTLALAGL
ncbi:4'-phosphopantetheinyl transferase family protein [Methylocapsa aurea]|uniref:4'-phosphopantetheinyl transferase family protein n=1 Tax=Methylocapsa aurea TaxID=663610 RepID=UPI00138E3E81|nr:4'-phosphopantetheinyl transferase superfamily protein [Methylocapsa aurea]